MIRTALLATAAVAALAAPAAVPDGIAPPADTAHVVNVSARDVLAMYAHPTGRSRLVGTIPPFGRDVRVEHCEPQAANRWCRVTYLGRWGWVEARHLATR